MILFCHFQVKPLQSIAFDFKWKGVLEELNSAFHLVEADNHSEGLLLQEISKIISEAPEIICFLEVAKNEKIGTLSKVFECLRKSAGKMLFLVNGENEYIEKMLPMLQQNVVKCESEGQLKSALTAFMKA